MHEDGNGIMRNAPTVAHVMECYLGATETFVHEYLAAFTRVRPIVLARRFENLDRFPLPREAALLRSAPRRGSPRWMAGALRRRLRGGQPHHLLYTEHLLRREKARLMHAHFGPAGAELIDVKQRTRLPLVTSFYGYDASMEPFVEQMRDRYRRLFDIGDAFLVEGPAMKARLESLGCPRSRLRIQRIAIDPSRIRFGERRDPGSGPVKLLACGRLVEKKGFDTLLSALAQVRRSDKRLQLRLVGDGPLRPRLEQSIADLDLKDSVTLVGALPRGAWLEEMAASHIYVQPSRTGADGDSEGGAPTALLEAQASGAPIAATRHADIPFVVREGDSALLSDEADAGGLAASLARLASEPARWGTMGRAGRAFIEEHHDVRRLATELEIFYAGLAETGKV